MTPATRLNGSVHSGAPKPSKSDRRIAALIGSCAILTGTAILATLYAITFASAMSYTVALGVDLVALSVDAVYFLTVLCRSFARERKPEVAP